MAVATAMGAILFAAGAAQAQTTPAFIQGKTIQAEISYTWISTLGAPRYPPTVLKSRDRIHIYFGNDGKIYNFMEAEGGGIHYWGRKANSIGQWNWSATGTTIRWTTRIKGGSGLGDTIYDKSFTVSGDRCVVKYDERKTDNSLKIRDFRAISCKVLDGRVKWKG